MKRKKIVSVIAILLAVLMLLSLVVSAIPLIAYGDELDELQARKEELASQAASCKERIELLQEQQSNVLEQKVALEEQKRIAEEQIEVISEEIASYTKLIEKKSEEVDAAKHRELVQLYKYRTRIRAMEENGGYNILALIVNAENFSQLLSAIDDMGEIMESDRKLQKAYESSREETERVKAQYETEKAQYESKQNELKKEQNELNSQIERAGIMLSELEEDIAKAIQEYEAAEAAEANASAAIASYIANLAAQKAAAAAEAKAAAEAEAQRMMEANAIAAENGEEEPYSLGEIQQAAEEAAGVLGGGNVSSGEGLMWPVPCSTRVTSRYGYRTDPFTGSQAYHSGIDIDGFNNEGGAVVAAASGTVTTAYSDGYGNYVIIDHGDMQTLYAHLSGFAVGNNQYVSQGETIGYLGSTGRATGTHCHFEVFVGGNRTDPAAYFSGISYYNC